MALSTDQATSARMSAQRSRDTGPELALRRALHRSGLRYRVHRRPLPQLRRQADVVFGPSKVAVFVDGCFWHGCPDHGTQPARNGDWWRRKIDRNIARDRETDQALLEAGWAVVRVWEHEDVSVAAGRVTEVVCLRRGVERPFPSSPARVRSWRRS